MKLDISLMCINIMMANTFRYYFNHNIILQEVNIHELNYKMVGLK